MTTTSMHLCVDIRGMLRWPSRKLKGALLHESGQKMTADEVRNTLYDCLAKGWKVLPLGDPCDGFSYETGCPGHTTTRTARGEG